MNERPAPRLSSRDSGPSRNGPPPVATAGRAIARAGLAALLAASLTGTASAAGPRPKLGVVLSGGGARGAAHVGVLKVLEELRVPVDLVAGTSMGSIVGGLYASGMSPAEMAEALTTMDWDDAFVDNVPRIDRPFRRKLDDAQYLTKLVVGIENGKVAFPTGLVEGQKLNFILRKLLLPAALVTDFDRLAIPYRCVATDVTDGSRVVLSKGDLAASIRASMAFPGLFAPVEIGGRLLVDGGVAENFPVETARQAGADVLVAVNIGTPPAGKEKLDNLLKIVNQVTSVATSRNVAASVAAVGPGDVYIQPQLGDISFISFTRASEAIALGEKAAREAADRLRAFSVPEDEYRAWLARVRRKPGPPPAVESVEFVNPSPVSNDRLRMRMRTKPGPLDLDTLGADLAALYSIGEFALVDFDLVPGPSGNVLRILIRDRSWGRTSARFGLDFNTDFKGTSGFELAATLTRTALNKLGGEWKLAGGIGSVQAVQGELYQPVVRSGVLFVAPRVAWSSMEKVVRPLDGDLYSFGREEVYGELDAGLTDGRLGEVRLGLRRGYLWAESRGGATLPEVHEDRGSVETSLRFDSRDSVSFPRRGAFVLAEASWQTPTLGAARSSRRIDGIASGSVPWRKSAIDLTLAAGSALGTDIGYYDQFVLGGFRRLSGYRTASLLGPYMVLGTLGLRQEIGRLPSIIGGGLYVGATLEAGNVWGAASDFSLSDLRVSGSVYLGGATPLGPVYVAYGIAEAGRSALYVLVGVPF